jgi:PAS domain-containing protein
MHAENLQLETKYLMERLTLALLAGDVGTWDYNLIKETISWDDRMYFLYGVKPEQFKDVYEAWQHSVHPEDKQRGD